MRWKGRSEKAGGVTLPPDASLDRQAFRVGSALTGFPGRMGERFESPLGSLRADVLRQGLCGRPSFRNVASQGLAIELAGSLANKTPGKGEGDRQDFDLATGGRDIGANRLAIRGGITLAFPRQRHGFPDGRHCPHNCRRRLAIMIPEGTEHGTITGESSRAQHNATLADARHDRRLARREGSGNRRLRGDRLRLGDRRLATLDGFSRLDGLVFELHGFVFRRELRVCVSGNLVRSAFVF